MEKEKSTKREVPSFFLTFRVKAEEDRGGRGVYTNRNPQPSESCVVKTK